MIEREHLWPSLTARPKYNIEIPSVYSSIIASRIRTFVCAGRISTLGWKKAPTASKIGYNGAVPAEEIIFGTARPFSFLGF